MEQYLEIAYEDFRSILVRENTYFRESQNILCESIEDLLAPNAADSIHPLCQRYERSTNELYN